MTVGLWDRRPACTATCIARLWGYYITVSLVDTHRFCCAARSRQNRTLLPDHSMLTLWNEYRYKRDRTATQRVKQLSISLNNNCKMRHSEYGSWMRDVLRRVRTRCGGKDLCRITLSGCGSLEIQTSPKRCPQASPRPALSSA